MKPTYAASLVRFLSAALSVVAVSTSALEAQAQWGQPYPYPTPTITCTAAGNGMLFRADDVNEWTARQRVMNQCVAATASYGQCSASLACYRTPGQPLPPPWPQPVPPPTYGRVILRSPAWSNLFSCGGMLEIGTWGQQVTLNFRDLFNCSNFDVIAINGYAVSHTNLKLQGWRPYGGSFTLRREFMRFGFNQVLVEMRSNSGAHRDRVNVAFDVY